MSTLQDTIENYNGSQKTLIDTINRKINGFASYHKVSEADQVFRKLDVYIKALFLELCEQRHPKWSREKILKKYWYEDAKGRYCYALPDKRETHVRFLADTLYVEYHPVETGFNPYIDKDYVEERTKSRAIANATGVYRSIWNRQEGKCYFCSRKILQDKEKAVVEIDGSRPGIARRNAYVHVRCLDGSIEYIDANILPSSATDVMELLKALEELLKALEGDRKPTGQKYLALAEFSALTKTVPSP